MEEVVILLVVTPKVKPDKGAVALVAVLLLAGEGTPKVKPDEGAVAPVVALMAVLIVAAKAGLAPASGARRGNNHRDITSTNQCKR